MKDHRQLGPDRPLCGFCKHGEEVLDICGRLHHEKVDEGIVAAHQKCMQYSANLEQFRFDHFGGFHIENVIEEIKRGSKLKCWICKKNNNSRKVGASCGCAVRSCSKTFHFYCAATSDSTIVKRFRVEHGSKGVILYRVYCCVEHKEADKANIRAGNVPLPDDNSDSESNSERDAQRKQKPKSKTKSESMLNFDTDEDTQTLISDVMNEVTDQYRELQRLQERQKLRARRVRQESGSGKGSGLQSVSRSPSKFRDSTNSADMNERVEVPQRSISTRSHMSVLHDSDNHEKDRPRLENRSPAKLKNRANISLTPETLKVVLRPISTKFVNALHGDSARNSSNNNESSIKTEEESSLTEDFNTSNPVSDSESDEIYAVPVNQGSLQISNVRSLAAEGQNGNTDTERRRSRSPNTSDQQSVQLSHGRPPSKKRKRSNDTLTQEPADNSRQLDCNTPESVTPTVENQSTEDVDRDKFEMNTLKLERRQKILEHQKRLELYEKERERHEKELKLLDLQIEYWQKKCGT